MKYVELKYGLAMIEIWWYTSEGEIWAKAKPTENGIDAHGFVVYGYSDNHSTLWEEVVREHLSDQAAEEQISKGYESLERGSVIYNVRTQCYEILCSDALYYNSDFRNRIKDYFCLRDYRVQFLKLQHYDVEELTGNSALDRFYFDN